MTEAKNDTIRIFVGTYTRREPHADGKSAGIHMLRFDPSSGDFSNGSVIRGIENPSYLAVHPGGKALYAISEVRDYDGRSEGAVYAYALDPDTDDATLLNHRSTRGPGPAYITIDAGGANVLVANYGGGSVCVLPVRADFSLGGVSAFMQHEGSSANRQRQEAPHAHSIVLDGANRYALAADLGIDKVMIYRYHAEDGTISPNPDQPWARTKSGAGPRHIAFHPSQEFVYVINELDSTITVYRYDAAKGVMTETQNVQTLPDGFAGRNHTADIQVHSSGRFLYGSNRGHDSIVEFSVDEETGKLELIGHVATGGECPRGFALDPHGRYALVANQDTDNIVVFAIDAESGELTPTGTVAEAPTPVCIKMLA